MCRKVIFDSLVILLVVAVFGWVTFVSGDGEVSAQSLQEVSLGWQEFDGQLNQALYYHPKGLQGKPGIVRVPTGRWVQNDAVVVRSGQKIIGVGSRSVVLSALNTNEYIISNRAAMANQEPESKNGHVQADNVEIANLTVAYNFDTQENIRYHRAVVFQGWPAEENLDNSGQDYVLQSFYLHDTVIKGVAGVGVVYTDNARIENNQVLGVRDFSDRCYWKKNHRSVHADAGIFISRGNRNANVQGNRIKNFGAEGITIDWIGNAGDEPGDQLSHHIKIKDNYVENTGRAALDIYGGNYNLFENNIVVNGNLFRHRVAWNTYIQGGRENTFRNNRISGFGPLIRVFDQAPAGTYVQSNGNIIENNTFEYLGLGWPERYDCGITTEYGPDYGALLSASDKTTWQNNTIIAPSTNYNEVPAFYIRSREGHFVQNNIIKGFSNVSYIHEDASNVQLTNNAHLPNCSLGNENTPLCDNTTNLLDLLHWRKNLATGEASTQPTGILGYLQVLRGWFIQ